MSPFTVLTSLLLVGAACAPQLHAAPEKPFSLAEARQRVGQKVLVEVEIVSAKDRLEKRGEIYLDADVDFRSEKNLAIVISRAGAESLKQAGVGDPASHYLNKILRVRGVVTEMDGVPRIEVADAAQFESAKAP